jgi:hypothetical protein
MVFFLVVILGVVTVQFPEEYLWYGEEKQWNEKDYRKLGYSKISNIFFTGFCKDIETLVTKRYYYFFLS